MEINFHKCFHCGSAVTILDKFCGVCGARATRPCYHCQHEVPNHMLYCPYCGTALPPVKMEEGLSPEDKEKILVQRETVGFERKLTELDGKLTRLRRTYVWRRRVELFVLMALVVAFFFLEPYLDEYLNAMQAASPARNMTVLMAVVMLVFLLVYYVVQGRRRRDDEAVEEVKTRILLTRHHMEQSLMESRSTGPAQDEIRKDQA